MAKEIYVKKNTFGNFEPVGNLDRCLIEELPKNVTLKAKITRTRSVRQNNYYWVILSKVVENQSCFPSSKVLHAAIKNKLGYDTEYQFPDGSKFIYQGSTSFEDMENGEYKIFFDKAMQLICTDIIPGLDLDALMRESQ